MMHCKNECNNGYLCCIDCVKYSNTRCTKSYDMCGRVRELLEINPKLTDETNDGCGSKFPEKEYIVFRLCGGDVDE